MKRKQPSTSSKSAASPSTQYRGFSRGFDTVSSPTIEELDGDILLSFKKLHKTSSVTKLKGLKEISELSSTLPTSNLDALLRNWVQEFIILTRDCDPRVRDATYKTMGTIAGVAKKKLGNYLKNILSVWVGGMFDTNKEVVNSATESLKSSIPPQKHAQAIFLCNKDYLDNLGINFNYTIESLNENQSIDPVLAKERYERTISSAISALGFLLIKLDDKQLEDVYQHLQQLCDATFWAFLSRKDSILIRRAAHQFITTSIKHYPKLIEDKLEMVTQELLTHSFIEKEIGVHSAMWEALMLTLNKFPQCWTLIQANRFVLPKIFEFYSNGGYGSTTISYPSLLPLISLMPKQLIGKGTNFHGKLFTALRKGLLIENAGHGTSEIIVKSYLEISKYFLSESIKKIDEEKTDKGKEKENEEEQKIIEEEEKRKKEVIKFIIEDSVYELIVLALTKRIVGGNRTVFRWITKFINDLFIKSQQNNFCEISWNNLWLKIDNLFKKILTDEEEKEDGCVERIGWLLGNASGTNIEEEKWKENEEIIKIAKNLIDISIPLGKEKAINENEEIKKKGEEYIKLIIKISTLFPNILFTLENYNNNLSIWLNNWVNIYIEKNTEKGIIQIDQIKLLFNILINYLNYIFNLNKTDEFNLNWNKIIDIVSKDDKLLVVLLKCLGSNNLIKWRCSVINHKVIDASSDLGVGNYSKIDLLFVALNGLSGDGALVGDDVVNVVVEEIMDVLKKKGNGLLEVIKLVNVFVVGKSVGVDVKIELLKLVFDLGRLISNDKTDIKFRVGVSNKLLDKSPVALQARELFPKCFGDVWKVLSDAEKDNLVEQLVSTINWNTWTSLNDYAAAELVAQQVYLLVHSLQQVNYLAGTNVDSADKLTLESNEQKLLTELLGPADTWKQNIFTLSSSTNNYVWVALSLLSVGKADSDWIAQRIPDTYLVCIIYIVQLFVASKSITKCDILLNNLIVIPFDKIVTILQSGSPVDGKKWVEDVCFDSVSSEELENRLISAVARKPNVVSEAVELIRTFGNDPVSKNGVETVLFFIATQLSKTTNPTNLWNSHLKNLWESAEWLEKENIVKIFKVWMGVLEGKKLDIDMSAIGQKLSELLYKESADIINRNISISERADKLVRIVSMIKVHISRSTTDDKNNELYFTYLQKLFGKDSTAQTGEMNEHMIDLYGAVSTFLNSLVTRLQDKFPAQYQPFLLHFSKQALSQLSSVSTTKEIAQFRYVLSLTGQVAQLVQTSEKVINVVTSESIRPYLADIARSMFNVCVSICPSGSGNANIQIQHKLIRWIVDLLPTTAICALPLASHRKTLCSLITPSSSSNSTSTSTTTSSLQIISFEMQKTAYRLLLHDLMTEITTASKEHTKPTESKSNEDEPTNPINPELYFVIQSGAPPSENSPLEDIFGYLLGWSLVLDNLSLRPAHYRAQVSAFLRFHAPSVFHPFLSLLFSFIQPFSKQHSSDKVLLFKIKELESLSFISLSYYASHLYVRVLRGLPVLVRGWWTEVLDRGLKAEVEKYTTKCVSAALLEGEIGTVARFEHDFDNFTIKASKVSREIVALYEKDEMNLEIVIKLPVSYPLKSVDISCSRRMGVSEALWRKWMLSMSTMFLTQDGTILDALLLWKDNLDKHFEGVEVCPICYSVFHISDYSLPKLSCKTCKNKFHSACMYKWIRVSHNTDCPLCKTPFN